MGNGEILQAGPEKKELNDAMSKQESRKTTRSNQTEKHARSMVQILSKGAKAKCDQKQMLAEQKIKKFFDQKQDTTLP